MHISVSPGRISLCVFYVLLQVFERFSVAQCAHIGPFLRNLPNKRPMSITSWKQIYYNIIKMKTQTAKSRLGIRKNLSPVPLPTSNSWDTSSYCRQKRSTNRNEEGTKVKKWREKWDGEHFVAKTRVTNDPHYTLKSKGTLGSTYLFKYLNIIWWPTALKILEITRLFPASLNIHCFYFMMIVCLVNSQLLNC